MRIVHGLRWVCLGLLKEKVESGWRNLAITLAQDGQQDLARDVQRFVDEFRPPLTKRELSTQSNLHHRQHLVDLAGRQR